MLDAVSAARLTPVRRRRALSDAAKRRDPTQSNDLRRRINTNLRLSLAEWRRQLYATIVEADRLGFRYGDVDPEDAEDLIDRLDTLLRRQAEFHFAASADNLEINLRTAYARGVARAGKEIRPVLPTAPTIEEEAAAARADLENMLDDQIDKGLSKLRVDSDAASTRNKLYALLLPAVLLPMAGRLRSLATTSVTKSYNAGKIDAYEELGLEQVGVMAETQPGRPHEQAEAGETALGGEEPVLPEGRNFPRFYTVETVGDDIVCAICEGYEGNAYTLDEARDLIPAHPHCRCSIVAMLA